MRLVRKLWRAIAPGETGTPPRPWVTTWAHTR